MVSKFINLATLKSNLLLIVIWLAALFVRFYRQDQLLGFYYDQGRDAKMAHDIITLTNLPTIGPTTGIQGLYLGPFWYYLITPGYFFGNGNPAVAALFISVIESFSIFLLFYLLTNYYSKSAGYLAIIFWSFSNYLVRSSRWFSNPTPIPTFSLLLILFLLNIVIHRRYYQLLLLTLFLGLSLQLEAASAIFFIPSILLFLFVNFDSFKKIPLKYYFYSSVTFFLTLIPQLAFEIKNHFPTTKVFVGFLSGKVNTTSGKSWGIPTIEFVINRLKFYYQVFFTKLDTNLRPLTFLLFILFIIGLFYLFKTKIQNKLVQISLIWLLVPLFLLLFFQGNYGTLYDYYLTGFFSAFIIVFCLSIFSFPNRFLVILFSFLSLVIFFNGNLIHLKNYLIANPDGPTHISLGNQTQALLFACQQTQDYNLNIYVPPITPHTYEYLLSWYSSKGICKSPSQSNQKTVISLYEVDPNNPSTLANWLKSQDTIGRIEKQQIFGGVIVQQRLRQ